MGAGLLLSTYHEEKCTQAETGAEFQEILITPTLSCGEQDIIGFFAFVGFCPLSLAWRRSEEETVLFLWESVRANLWETRDDLRGRR